MVKNSVRQDTKKYERFRMRFKFVFYIILVIVCVSLELTAHLMKFQRIEMPSSQTVLLYGEEHCAGTEESRLRQISFLVQNLASKSVETKSNEKEVKNNEKQCLLLIEDRSELLPMMPKKIENVLLGLTGFLKEEVKNTCYAFENCDYRRRLGTVLEWFRIFPAFWGNDPDLIARSLEDNLYLFGFENLFKEIEILASGLKEEWKTVTDEVMQGIFRKEITIVDNEIGKLKEMVSDSKIMQHSVLSYAVHMNLDYFLQSESLDERERDVIFQLKFDLFDFEAKYASMSSVQWKDAKLNLTAKVINLLDSLEHRSKRSVMDNELRHRFFVCLLKINLNLVDLHVLYRICNSSHLKKIGVLAGFQHTDNIGNLLTMAGGRRLDWLRNDNGLKAECFHHLSEAT